MKPKSKARRLRNNSTDAENKLWVSLKKRKLGGFKFRRQAPIGKFFVDFVRYEKALIVVLDGG